jgi:hypothetical protein
MRWGWHTWRRRENGRQDLKVLFASIELMNAAQFDVRFALNPLSKGLGNGLADVVAVTAMPLDVVVGARVEDEALFTVDVIILEEEVEEDSS